MRVRVPQRGACAEAAGKTRCLNVFDRKNRERGGGEWGADRWGGPLSARNLGILAGRGELAPSEAPRSQGRG